MDNLILKKIWQDDNMIELKILGKSKYVEAYQNCYIQEDSLLEISKIIEEYIIFPDKECYIQIGEKTINTVSSFSMRILPSNYSGRMKIELDMEIEDEVEGLHRCMFYVNSELGLLEKLGKALLHLYNKDLESIVTLNPYQE